MKIKKIRGQKRRSKNIEDWIQANLIYNKSYFFKNHRDYCEVLVHPWCDISIINSTIPEPRRKNRRKIIAGLLDIYESWKTELDSLAKDYYLKIWLFEPYISKSQVVCAIDEKLHFYDNTFHQSNPPKAFGFKSYGELEERIKQYQWKSFEHEMTLEDDHLGEPEDYRNLKDYIETKKWLGKKLKKPHRTFTLIENGIERTFNAFPQGTIWIGGR